MSLSGSILASGEDVLLDALFTLGKDEADFDWVERMPVYRLDASVLTRCHAFLKSRHGMRTVYDLYGQFDGYCAFTPEELLEAVRRDERFVVEEESFWSPGICTRRKKDVDASQNEDQQGQELLTRSEKLRILPKTAANSEELTKSEDKGCSQLRRWILDLLFRRRRTGQKLQRGAL